MKRLLVLRFSAFGDVALTIPVVKEFLRQHPEARITFVSVAPLSPLFEGIDRLDFFPVYTRGRHKGMAGLFRLHSELMSTGSFDAVIDLHSVLRTHFLRSLFRLRGLPVHRIHKDRTARKALTRKFDKILKPLRSIPERYADVFRQAGFPLTLSGRTQRTVRPLSSATRQAIGNPEEGIWIGFAPFSRYPGKTYPLERMFEVIKDLSQTPRVSIILFGSRGEEAGQLESWSKKLERTYVAAGKISLSEELDLISQLDVMVSMDSANMHLASLMGVRVVSIWGATHPLAGFLGYGQDAKDVIEIPLDCRPCSVFGNRPCYKGTYQCLNDIPSARICQAVKEAAGIS